MKFKISDLFTLFCFLATMTFQFRFRVKFKLFMRLSLFFLSLLFSIKSFSQDSLSVLFIGNSYVYTYDLPNVLKNLAQSKGDILTVASKTNGGYTFQNHVNDPVTYSKIHLTDWNYVVLQGQSQEPSFPYAQVNSSTLPFAVQLADSVYANSSCSQAVYFMTWGRQNGDSQWDSINTFDKMNQRLRDAYLRIADAANGSVAPAGPAWKYIRDNYPNINLFSADGSHPSFEGTYLNACVFYASLYHKSPVGASYYGTLDSGTATILQQCARLTVLDSLDTWKLVDSDSLTQVNIVATMGSSATEVNFSANSNLVSNYFWNFGDGTTSNMASPSHTYPSAGTYYVQLIGEGPCGIDTAFYSLIISTATISTWNLSASINALSSTEFLLTNSSRFKVNQIIDVTGKKISYQTIPFEDENSLKVIVPNSGIYFIHCSTENGEYTLKTPIKF
jgi:hypothetical protein